MCIVFGVHTRLSKKVVVIYTSTVSLEDLKSLFVKIMHEVEMVNIIDESLLREVMANGKITLGITKRICSYAIHAQDIGAHLILNQRSSVGEAVNVARNLINIPYVKIDEQMAEDVAEKLGKEVSVKKCLVDGALEILMQGKNIEKYNRLVIDVIEKKSKTCDVIALPQGSMIGILPLLQDIKVPVLSNPESGVRRVAKILESI